MSITVFEFCSWLILGSTPSAQTPSPLVSRALSLIHDHYSRQQISCSHCTTLLCLTSRVRCSRLLYCLALSPLSLRRRALELIHGIGSIIDCFRPFFPLEPLVAGVLAAASAGSSPPPLPLPLFSPGSGSVASDGGSDVERWLDDSTLHVLRRCRAARVG